MTRLPILNHNEIALKLDRIAWQILEEHYDAKEIVLVGIEDRGFLISGFLVERLRKFSEVKISHASIAVDKKHPLVNPVKFEAGESVAKKPIILVDDVLNSGITMAAAIREMLNHNPSSLKVAVLANRDHHKYPVQANFVGISMATTLQEHITFQIVNDQMSVWLD